ncbi:hypothetical protein ACFFV7_36955 [Nonomuraea spiralis]|uniref:Uncharacterized protein n=1 Tax=Nonomuraea spiralis TaxID=46182 RepID=A0ABV5IQK8_9ACTN|nr:hypothetical protein [Nonomuraea spiralis]GGT47277.1 hypothetical protein GCM10010176_107640 [Nonomuraea spiralis]
MEFVKALLIFQQYTLARVTIPPLADISERQMHRIGTVADLLLGKVYSSDWRSISIKVSGARIIAAQSTPSSAIVQMQPLVVDLGSKSIEFDIEEQYIFQRPTCLVPIEELEAMPDDEIVELVPGEDSKLIHRLPVEHVPRMVEVD